MTVVIDNGFVDSVSVSIVGVLGGFGIGGAVFFLTTVGKIKSDFIERTQRMRNVGGFPELTQDDLIQIGSGFKSAAKEAYHNCIVIIAAVVLAVAAALFLRLDIPWVHWPACLPWTKSQFIHGASLFSVGLCLLSVFDLTRSLFMLRDLEDGEV